VLGGDYQAIGARGEAAVEPARFERWLQQVERQRQVVQAQQRRSGEMAQMSAAYQGVLHEGALRVDEQADALDVERLGGVSDLRQQRLHRVRVIACRLDDVEAGGIGVAEGVHRPLADQAGVGHQPPLNLSDQKIIRVVAARAHQVLDLPGP